MISVDLSTLTNIEKNGVVEEITELKVRGQSIWRKTWIDNIVQVNYPTSTDVWIPPSTYYTTEYSSHAFYFYWYVQASDPVAHGAPNKYTKYQHENGTWYGSTSAMMNSTQSSRWIDVSSSDRGSNIWRGEIYNTYQQLHNVAGYYDTQVVDNYVAEDHSYWQYTY